METEKISGFEDTKDAFLYIPDMSGFTKIITRYNILRVKPFINRLLEIILDSNILNLKVAEIQGDNVVFYKFGTPPSISKLEEQSKKTFLDFQHALKKFELENPNLKDLRHLSLKIITHFGTVASMKVKDTTKLISGDFILAHRILKNNLSINEYLLMTNDYLKTQKKEWIEKSFQWSRIIQSKQTYEHFGNIEFKYVPLKSLREPVRELMVHHEI